MIAFNNQRGAFTPEQTGGFQRRMGPIRTEVPNYQPPAENYTKAPASGYQVTPTHTPQWSNTGTPTQQPAGPTAPQTPAAGQAPIQTNITPQPIYTPQMTQWAVNQAVADNAPDFRSAMKQFDRPGVSRSAGTMAAALPTVANAQLAQRQAASQIPLLDEIANQKHLLSGETAREQQALEMSGLLNRLNQTNQQAALQNRQQGLQNWQQNSSLLSALLGMF